MKRPRLAPALLAPAMLALAVLAPLAGCGTPARLRPLATMEQVPVANGAQVRATPVELMAPTTQARPDRKADLITRSAERQDDPFDLPPGPDNGRAGAAAEAMQSTAGGD